MPAKKGKKAPLPPASPARTRSAAKSTDSQDDPAPVQDRLTRIESAIEKMMAFQTAQAEQQTAENTRGRPKSRAKATQQRGRRSVSLDLPYTATLDHGFQSSFETNQTSHPTHHHAMPPATAGTPLTDIVHRHVVRPDPDVTTTRPTNPPWNAAATCHPIDTVPDQNINNPWRSWLAGARQPTAENSQSPVISPTAGSEDIEKQVQNILATTVHNLSKGNTTLGTFPFKLVSRGPEKKKIAINQATLAEHLWGILRIVKDPKTNPSIIVYLLKHLEDVIEDSCDFEWVKVRRWSEEIFSLVAENRLASGWGSLQRIQMLRMNLSRVESGALYQPQLPIVKKQQYSSFHTDASKGGPPCQAYNSPGGCPLPAGHVVNGRKMSHICTFCLYNSSAAYTHSETQCRNRLRFPPPAHFH